MKKLVILLIINSLFAFAQTKNEIVIGSIDYIDSKILNEPREIWIHLPQNFSTNKQYLVVYLLDAEAHFYSVVGLINHLSYSNGNTICPEMIVVGITNTNRTRDLTPFKGDSNDIYLPPQMLAESGGGENFISFIEKELIPYIESNYPVAPYRMLIGHSFGGLTVLSTFLHHTKLFNSYIAIDPSVSWSSSRLLKEFKNSSAEKSYDNITLFIGIANIDKGKNLNETLLDTTYLSEHIRSIFALDEHLKNNSKNKLKYASKFYENEMHTTVPLLTEYDAFHFIFDFYDMSISIDDYDDPNFNLAGKIENHYNNISQKFGFEIKPAEPFINGMSYQFLMMQQMEKAGGLFKLNVSLYPESANVYDSLGDFYSANGEKEKAIESYKTAQSIEYHDYTEAKLKELEKE